MLLRCDNEIRGKSPLSLLPHAAASLPTLLVTHTDNITEHSHPLRSEKL